MNTIFRNTLLFQQRITLGSYLFYLIRVLILVTILFIANSCKNHDIDSKTCLIRTADYVYTSGHKENYEFGYNTEQQLTTVMSSSNLSTTATTRGELTYSEDKIEMKVSPAISEGLQSATYFLNSQGYISKITTVWKYYGSSVPQSSDEFFEYDSEGYLVKYFNGYGYYNYEYTNGNRTSEKYYENGILKISYAYTYDENQSLTTASADDPTYFSIPYPWGYYGKQNKNPITKSVSTDPHEGTKDYTYTYDSDNNISSRTQKRTLNGESTPAITHVDYYTYKCD
jgi:hypothetical protein